MRRFGRVLGGVVVLLLTLLVVLVGGGYLWLRFSLPRYGGTVEVSGLAAPVEIVRDEHAVPHIFAANASDAAFALGYVHAQDRLWWIDIQRRLGAGRLAEIVGPAALASDRYMRTLGLYRAAAASYAALAPEVRAALDAYAAGVNAWLSSNAGRLPPEFQILRYRPEPWTATDSLVWGKLMALQLSGNYRTELLRAQLLQRLAPNEVADLFPPYPADAPATLQTSLRDMPFDRLRAALPPPLGPDTASNEWVLGPTRTATGGAILANDPHLGLQAPILWYLARIEAPGLTLVGATVPGVPFLVLGHNGSIAWGFTTTGSDTQDVFVEKLDPGDHSRYLTPDGSAPLTVRREVIRVKGGADVPITIRTTRHGPVISDLEGERTQGDADRVEALAFTGLGEADTTAEALYRLDRAHDWNEFRDALRLFQSPQQNIVFADTAGNIGFLAPGLVPIRKGGDGTLPLPGWTGDDDWGGFIPFDGLPQAYNPPSGRFVNANNKVVGPDYPYRLAAVWEDAYRALRIEERLAAEPRASVDGTVALQMDAVSLAARQMLPLLLRVTPDPGPAAEAAALLARWDGTMGRDRPEPLIFEAWIVELGRTLAAGTLGRRVADLRGPNLRILHHILTEAPQWCAGAVAAGGADPCADALRVSLTAAVTALSARHGTTIAGWRWGSEHRAPLAHQLFAHLPPLGWLFDIGIETDGGNFTINRAGFSPDGAGHPFEDRHGPGYRGVYDLSDLDNSRFVIATGQSGNPLSPHYGDLVRRWRDGQPFTIAGAKQEVAATGLGTLTLRPR